MDDQESIVGLEDETRPGGSTRYARDRRGGASTR